MTSALDLFTRLLTMSKIELLQAKMATEDPKMRKILQDAINLK